MANLTPIAAVAMAMIFSFGAAQAETRSHDVPGGGRFEVSDKFRPMPPPEYLNPTTYRVLFLGHTVTLGGYRRFDAALAVAHTSNYATLEDLLAEAGKNFQDWNWQFAIEAPPNPPELTAEGLLLRTQVVRPGWISSRKVPAIALGREQDDGPLLAIVFSLSRNIDEAEAAALIDAVFTSAERP